MPLRVVVTEGTRADCKQACALIDGLSAEALLADRGYDSNELIDKVVESDPKSPVDEEDKCPNTYKGQY